MQTYLILKLKLSVKLKTQLKQISIHINFDVFLNICTAPELFIDDKAKLNNPTKPGVRTVLPKTINTH